MVRKEALFSPDLISNGQLADPGKRCRKNGRYCPFRGIIWGIILAYFGK
jgi:hypothetical protein